jgi:hypothetical protein
MHGDLRSESSECPRGLARSPELITVSQSLVRASTGHWYRQVQPVRGPNLLYNAQTPETLPRIWGSGKVQLNCPFNGVACDYTLRGP